MLYEECHIAKAEYFSILHNVQKQLNERRIMKPILAQRLRAARQAMTPEITQRDVAKRLNLSPSAINLWEAGKTEPSALALAELSRWYHVSIDWLLGVDSNSNNKQTIVVDNTEAVIHTVPIVPPSAIARWHLDSASELLQTSIAYPGQTAAAILVSSDAVTSICPAGCFAVVSNAYVPESGKIVLALINNASEPVLRKYVREGGDSFLVADDTRFPTHCMNDGVRIVGLVTEIIIRKLLL